MTDMTDPPITEVQALLPFAGRLADAARQETLPRFRSPALSVETKDDHSPVTVADRGAEAAMRALIAEHCPDHGILGEEEAPTGLDRDFVWVLDPIDGTRSFVTGQPLWGTLIGLSWRGTPVLGIIDAPAMNERWIGCVGQPTTYNGQPCRARACGSLDRAVLYTSTPDLFEGADRAGFEALSARILERRFCADCYAYGMVASGWIDIALDPAMKPYDYMALVPVVTGAGGVMTEWSGAPARQDSDGWVIASGDAAVHAAARALLTGQQGG